MYKRSKYEIENILSIFQTYYRYIHPVSLTLRMYEDGIESHNDTEQATEQ